MKFILLDESENYLATLKDVTQAHHKEELNGEDYLELTSLDKNIKKGHKVLYKNYMGHWKEFIVQGAEEEHREGDFEHTQFCESSLYETIGDYIENDGVEDGTLTNALSRALVPTRWTIGMVDIPDINTVHFHHMSSKEAIQLVVNTWGGELRTRVDVAGTKIVSRQVDILKDRGNKVGKRFTYTKDLLGIKRIIHRAEVQTALYGYGGMLESETNDEERLTIRSVNGDIPFVEDTVAKDIYGRLQPDGTRTHVFGHVYFDDIKDPTELLEATTKALADRIIPNATYECSVMDLQAYGEPHEGVDLGDTVHVIDKTFTPEIRIEAKVISIDRDLLYPENTKIVLGNYREDVIDSDLENEEFINDARDKALVWDRASIINQNGSINSEYLNNLIASLNDQLNAQGGYVYFSEDGQGFTTYNKPIDQNPTKAIQIVGGAFRIANSKLPNGEFNWRTFGDGDGFMADVFIGGILKGGLVNFDLTNGTLLIGESIENHSLYFDGSTLSIRMSNGQPIEEFIEDSIPYKVELLSTEGNIFTNGRVSTILKATVYKGVEDVTHLLHSFQFVWERSSDDKPGDVYWNSQHTNLGSEITITGEDVDNRATFFCKIN